MIYIGPGKARNLAEAAKDLACQNRLCWMRWSAALCSWQLGTAAFCSAKALSGADGQQIPGIGWFDYTGEETGNVFISDVLAHPIFAPETALMVLSTEPPIFMVMTGIRSLL